MGTGWLPWSAASLASGAVLLVLGALSMPPTSEVGQVIAAVDQQDAAWLMASVSFFLASVGLTMGLPTVLSLFTDRSPVLCLVGLWLWAIGTIGTAGVAALLILFRATVQAVDLTPAQVEELSADRVLSLGLLVIAGGFYLGEAVVAVALLRAAAVARWVPVTLLVHVAAAPLSELVPVQLQGLHAVALGAGLMGIAVTSTERWADTRSPTPL